MKKFISKVSAFVKKASLNYFFWLGCAVLIFLAAVAIFG